MEKEEVLDNRFEQIEALNARIMNSKIILNTLNDRLYKAQEEGNAELVQELNNKIEIHKIRIEENSSLIRKINGEINEWRQPEKKQEENKDENIVGNIPEKKNLKWYNFIKRFKNWIEKKKQKSLNEGLEEGITEEQSSVQEEFKNELRVEFGGNDEEKKDINEVEKYLNYNEIKENDDLEQ